MRSQGSRPLRRQEQADGSNVNFFSASVGANVTQIPMSFNGKLRDEFLNGEIFYSLKEAQILTERWRVEYNTQRPHSALGYKPPAPQAILPKQQGHGDME